MPKSQLLNNMNNNKNKSTTLKTFLMLSVVTMMMLIPGGIIPVHAAPGNLLLTINNPTPDSGDRFGFSIASTNTGDILVGTPNDDTGATDAGSVYLLDGITWSLKLTINNPTPAVSDHFGFSIASTNTGDILVGAYGDSTGAMYAGSVYLFDGTTGSLKLTINNPTPAVSDNFGRSIASTNTGDILVGAQHNDIGGESAGSVYLFDGTTGNLLLTINNPTPAWWDQFGYAVASTNTGDILAGSNGDIGEGNVYLFEGMPTLYCGEPESFYNVIDGTESPDYLLGTNNPDLIFGNGGNDLIYSMGEDNCIYAGDGHDFVFANKDGNIVYGGAGDDSILLKGTGIAYGEDGDDAIHIIKPSAGHLIDGGNDYDLCTTNTIQTINTIHCEIVS